MNAETRAHPKVLPPRALLYSLAGQVPLLVFAWPLSPPTWCLAAGAGLLIWGALLNVWAERLFRREKVGVCPFSPVPRLIVEGPYRLSRNPMYLGLVFISLGVVLVTGAAWNLWAPLALFVWLHFRLVLPEEQFLRSLLGSPFEEYAMTHPRWLGPVALKSSPTVALVEKITGED
jgi:protein-S-isoprenylcysteine O-methyltransferase Ste14